jgi:hypothetical protein
LTKSEVLYHSIEHQVIDALLIAGVSEDDTPALIEPAMDSVEKYGCEMWQEGYDKCYQDECDSDDAYERDEEG